MDDIDQRPGDDAPRMWVALLLLFGVWLISFVSRWPFRDVPLIRDEGEYAQLGQQILSGAVPYLEIYNQKPPLSFYFMALVQMFAPTDLVSIRIATIFYGLVTLSVVFVGAYRFFGLRVSAWTALAFDLLLFDMCGTAHASSSEFFMLLWIALAVWCWMGAAATSSGYRLSLSAVAAGLATGLAVQTKQTGLALIGYFLLDTLWQLVRRHPQALSGARLVSRLAIALVSFSAISAATLGYFASQGALDAYLECVWLNNFAYVGQRHETLGRLFALLFHVVTKVVGFNFLFWVVGAISLFVVARKPGNRDGLWILLSVQMALSLYAGSPYTHYYEPLVFPIAIGMGFAMDWVTAELLCNGKRSIGGDFPLSTAPVTEVPVGLIVAIVLVAWLGPGYVHLRALWQPEKARERIEAIGPFGAAETLGTYLKEWTDDEEPILIIGSEPQIYFYAARPAATRMVITYPMTGPYRYSSSLREEFLRDLEGGPRYVVLVRDVTSLTESPALLPRLLTPVGAILARDYALHAGMGESGLVLADDPGIRESSILFFRRKSEALEEELLRKRL